MALVALIGALSASVPRAFAQTDVPDVPTAVAVYSIESQKLEVRWSSADAASTASFKIQWKSGTEEYDSSRQLSSDPATSIESAQSTSAGDRYKDIITGLADGTEYTVRVLATNSNGDSGSSNEATGTPQSTPGQSREFIENEVVEILESSFPWLRETWDYMTAQNVFANFGVGQGGVYSGGCSSPVYLTDSDLWRCKAFGIVVGRSDPRVIDVIIHELGHVYTLANDVASTPAPLGIAHLYFLALVSPDGRGGPGSACNAVELYADGLLILTLGDEARDRSSYWRQCSVIDDTVSEQALGVLRSVAAGQMPSWFADTYNDSVGDPDLVRVWADVKAMLGGLDRQRAVVYQLRNAFGGYCDDSKATDAAFGSGVTVNPWRDGGCVPDAPTSMSVTAVGRGKLTVSWPGPPLNDGGSPIEGYKLQWKSGTQEYSSSRQVVVTNLTNIVQLQTISGLTNDESHTIRLLAYNHNGDGAGAEVTATPTATDTTAPVLLLAQFDEYWVRLIWSEALDESSVPPSTAFTVTVNGVARDGGVGITGNRVSLGVSGGVTLTDVVTVSYTAPTGSEAMPLRDSVGNSAPDFSAQMVRYDGIQIVITDPGPGKTYILGRGFGRQDAIEATVTFSERVTVSGLPELELELGGGKRRAAYHSGSGTTSLVFRYKLTEGDIDTDGIWIRVSGRISKLTGPGQVHYASTKAVAPARLWASIRTDYLVDAVRPTLVRANALANGKDVTLTWDKALDEDSVPTATGTAFFAVTDTSDDTSRQITAISVLDKVVTLTLSSAISATDQLTVSYHDPFRHIDIPFPNHIPVKDAVGNHAGSNSAVVSITDTPNRSPEFPTAEDGRRSVDENTPAGQNIGAPIVATDADNDRLTYSISRHPSHLFNVFDVFDVDATTGQLRTKGALDEEMRDTYRLTMSASDGKDPHGNADTTIDDTISVTVTVNDVDEPPLITPDSDIVVDENHEGRLVGFNAYDPERLLFTHTLSLAGRDGGDFSLTEAGVLTFASTPDYERPADSDRNNVYDLTVNAVDGDGKIGSIDITVTVRPVNEPPAISGDAMPSLEEEGALLVGTYQAVDPENATTVWQPLAGSDRDKFEFTASNGRLAFMSAPNFEAAADTGGNNVYDVRLSASGGGQTATFDARIRVTNREETGSLSFSSPVPRVGTDYTATLSDSDDVVSTTWAWERSTSRTSGWASVSGAVDGATTSVYTPVAGDIGYYLRVTAAYTDGHGPDKSLVQRSTHAVRAAPVTNAPPSFSGATPTRSITENAGANARVGDPVTASDTDSGDVLTYELSGSDLFTIDGNSGQIRVVADNSLDHESAPSHSMTIKVSDTSNAFDTVTVSVTVEDVNEPPNAVPDASTMREDTEATINVLANDSDPEDDVSDLTVRAGSARHGRAVVNTPQNPGEFYTITYTPRANYNGADSFTYTVQDNGSPSRSDAATVSINVVSVNDDPTFPSTMAGRSVLESAGEGDDVGPPVTATDIDGDELTYGLSGADEGFFDIGLRSGQITVGAGVSFDVATRGRYTVTVDADDANGGRSTVEVIITVTTRPVRPPIITTGGGDGGGGVPVNRPPVFEDADGNAITETRREIEAGAALGAAVGEPVVATDPDEGTLTYTLSGDDASSFAIDASTGQLRTATELDHGTQAVYTVVVTATDPSDETAEIRVTITVTRVEIACSSGDAVSDAGDNSDLATDREALLGLRDLLAGTGTLNWSENIPIGRWDGVRLHGTPQRVTWLHLTRRGLNGCVPTDLGRLTSLRGLYLHHNELTGPIPSQLGQLTILTHLTLHRNRLSGELPAELGDLNDLVFLSLYGNGLGGELPEEMGGLSKLKWLYLHSNKTADGGGLTGAIPSTFRNLGSLERLLLYGNSLSGEIPAGLGELSDLKSLLLHDNEFTGPIPTELGNLSRLRYLWLDDNDLSGAIPPQLGNLSELRWLSLYGNNLSGAIPGQLGDLSGLRLLILDRNDLSGAIPARLGELSELTWLDLNDNDLSGPIPAELGDLSNLVHLYLHDNALTGPVPADLGRLTNLTNLWLRDNRLSGQIPPSLGELPNLQRVRIAGNAFTGCIPTGLLGGTSWYSDAEELGLAACASNGGP